MESFLFTTRDKDNMDNRRSTQNLFNPKTINQKYVLNVIQSELFLDHFQQYLHNDFIKDYLKTVEFKITKVIEKCYELVIKKKNGVNMVKTYVENNPKCKLPWSYKELESARVSVLDMINKKVVD
jgi:hypothetical protein